MFVQGPRVNFDRELSGDGSDEDELDEDALQAHISI